MTRYLCLVGKYQVRGGIEEGGWYYNKFYVHEFREITDSQEKYSKDETDLKAMIDKIWDEAPVESIYQLQDVFVEELDGIYLNGYYDNHSLQKPVWGLSAEEY